MVEKLEEFLLSLDTDHCTPRENTLLHIVMLAIAVYYAHDDRLLAKLSNHASNCAADALSKISGKYN